jgi:hypothetical protein
VKITLTKAIGGHDKGDVIDVPDSVGSRLVDRGVAEKKTTARKPAAD